MDESNSKPYGRIYCITHKETERVYIGQTVSSVAQRWASHKSQSACVLLHRAIVKYGADAFSVEQIDRADSKSELDELEAFYISAFGSTNRSNGFNLRGGGSFGKHSDESKAKMSVAVRKAYENPEFRAKLSAVRTGKKRTKEYCDLASQRMIGTKLTEFAKQKIAHATKAAWTTDCYKEKVAKAQKLARSDLDYLDKVSENSKSQWQDPAKRKTLIESRAKTQEAGNAARKAAWADPAKKAARVAKIRATLAAKKAEQI